MIPNTHPNLVAAYKDDGGGSEPHWVHLPVAGFDDDGTPLVIDQDGRNSRRVVHATTYSNYEGLCDDPHPRIVQIMPADGWRVEYTNGDGPVWDTPLAGWGLLADGEVVPLDADPDGFVEQIRFNGKSKTKYRIYHQEQAES